jgi:hypothetical protein
MNLEISENERVLLIQGLAALSKRRAGALRELQLILPDNEDLGKLGINQVGIGDIEDLARRLGGTSLSHLI